MAPKPETLVVVNCAGRTRSIIGAQSLINAGVPNKVVALRNGTMGWNLAGFKPDSGRVAARAGGISRCARLGEIRRRGCRRKARDPEHRRSGAGAASRRREPHDVCVRCTRSRRVCGGPCDGRTFGARRAARAGDRSVRRHAQRAHRRGGRQAGARRDDGIVASPDGLARGLRAGGGGRRKGPSRKPGAWDMRRARLASTPPHFPVCSPATKRR